MIHKMVSEKLLTVNEAEALTGRKASTWRRDILLRRIPYVKLGRQVRIPREAIEDLIRQGWHEPINRRPGERQ
jgi:excisionase family DNA binding protein